MSENETLDAFLDLGWRCLVPEGNDAPAQQGSFATISEAGTPEVRTVVLRNVARREARLEVHTDLRSGKVGSLTASPHAQLMVWDAKTQVQVRLDLDVSVRTGADAARQWMQVPVSSRSGYHAEPAPGTPLPGPLAYEKRATPEGYAVLSCDITRMEVLCLEGPHRRAVYTATDVWTGQWITP